MAVETGNKSNEFVVNGRTYKVEYARLVLARERLKTKTSTIIIPDGANKKYSPTKGRVVAAGEAASDFWHQQIGSEIIFARFAGDWVKLDDADDEVDEIFICQDEDALITRVS